MKKHGSISFLKNVIIFQCNINYLKMDQMYLVINRTMIYVFIAFYVWFFRKRLESVLETRKRTTLY